MAGKRITDLPEATLTPDTLIEVVQDGQSRSARLGSAVSRYLTINSDYTAVPGDRIGVDTSAGPVNVTLPPNPKNGDKIGFYDLQDSWPVNQFAILGYAPDDSLICDVSLVFHLIRLGSNWVIQDGIE